MARSSLKPRWRDDPERWDITSGTIMNILDNAEKDTASDERMLGLYPSEIVTHLSRIAAKYGNSDNQDLAVDAANVLQSVPNVMALISVLTAERRVGAGKASTVTGPLSYTTEGRVKLTDYGVEELRRIYADYSKLIGSKYKPKDVDMNEPLLKWSPAEGWGVSADENAKLPPRREPRSRLTYRQWLTMIFKESETYVAAQEGLMITRPAAMGTNERELLDERVRARRAQIKPVRRFAKLVLSGGPESVWLGKPLEPKDVHNDVESFFAAGKPGFNAQMTEASSLAWELWETDTVALKEYADVREWNELKKLEERSFGSKKTSSPLGVATDEAARPVAYDKVSHRDDPDMASKEIQKYDPLGVNGTMEFASSRLSESIIDPEKFASVNPDGSLSHMRCSFVYGVDNRDPGFVGHSRKGGTRCPNIAVAGNTRCEIHGGLVASPSETRAMIVASQMQAFALTGTAMQTIADIMVNGQTEAARLRAAETILNRSGIVEGAEIDIKDAKSEAVGGDGTSAKDIVMDRLLKLAQLEEQAKESEEEKKEELDSNTIEGEVVEDEKEGTA